MEEYTIRQAASLCGVSEDVIEEWGKEYVVIELIEKAFIDLGMTPEKAGRFGNALSSLIFT